METVDEVMQSEYNNILGLLGSIDLDNNGSLLGAVVQQIRKLPVEKQMKLLKKFKQDAPITVGHNSRHELEMRWDQLPEEIRVGLLKKRYQLVDSRIYTVKSIALKSTIDCFQGTDQKSPGLGNVASQKLEKDYWFLVSAIKVTYGTGVAKESAEYGVIPAVIRNGEFELEVGTKKLVGLMEAEVFNTTGRSNVETGVYKLDNVKIIEPQVEIKMPMKFAAAAADASWLRIAFIGTAVVPF